MTDDQHNTSHPWWARLAAQLGTPEGLRMARGLQQEGFFDVEERASGGDAVEHEGVQPISIWEPREVQGEWVFERPAPWVMGDHYATRLRIPLKKEPGRRRICFFGESVAAGYLYAPHCTPAQVLEQHLGAARGEAGYEVIDLARTNETLTALVRTVEQAMQLQPDALVLFIGNNWTLLETPYVSPYVPSVRARQRYAWALREGGVLGPITQATRQVASKAVVALTQVAEMAQAASIPLVLIIPEVNLADWETRQPVLWLSDDGLAQWYRYYEEALHQLGQGAWAKAAATAQAMIDLDGATCPSSFRLLAKAFMGAGDLEQAERACRDEIDANQYATLCFLSAPQATRMAQGVQRRAAQQYGAFIVDLPQVFAEHTGSPLPGRRLFLDYCHLTLEGIHVAMAATAATVRNACDDVEEPWQTLVQEGPRPVLTPEAEATALFGAALHSAHRLSMVGARASLLRYWCRAALAVSPGIVQAMSDYVAVRTAQSPALLSAAQRRNLASPYRLTFQHGWQYDYLDADIIEAIYAEVDPATREVIRERVVAHRLPPEGLDLAYPPFYLREPLEQFYPDVMPFDDLSQRATYRAPWPVSRFCLIDDATRDVDLAITLRRPSYEGERLQEEPVSIRLNGQDVQTIVVGTTWQKATVVLEKGMLKEGINDLALHWPMPAGRGEAALEAARSRLEVGVEADLHPVFGEVFSLRAVPSCQEHGITLSSNAKGHK